MRDLFNIKRGFCPGKCSHKLPHAQVYPEMESRHTSLNAHAKAKSGQEDPLGGPWSAIHGVTSMVNTVVIVVKAHRTGLITGHERPSCLLFAAR